MRIAIVGGGLFGCTAAIHLARAQHEVVLFDRAGALMQAASAINQGRLHEGFHYPRSPDTVDECRQGLRSFCEEYRRAIVGHAGLHFYALACKGSRTTAAQYGAFCRRQGLRYQIVLNRRSAGWLVNPEAVDVVLGVPEDRIDLGALRSIVVHRLEDCGVEVRFAPATPRLREDFDRIVIAAYAATNEVAADLGAPVTPFQFEVVEKPVVRMPDRFEGVGIVVMDGPFCCLDAWGRSRDGLHVMGHVEHAIHRCNVGLAPRVPPHLAQWLNRGVIGAAECGEHSRFQVMAEAGEAFIPALAEAWHVGSMFTVRAVLPDRDATDARPTLVDQLDDQVIRIFGGKLSCAVMAAQRAAGMLQSSRERRDAPAPAAA